MIVLVIYNSQRCSNETEKISSENKGEAIRMVLEAARCALLSYGKGLIMGDCNYRFLLPFKRVTSFRNHTYGKITNVMTLFQWEIRG